MNKLKKKDSIRGDFVLNGTLTLFGDNPSDCRVRYYKALEEYFPDLIPKTKSIFKSKFYTSHKYQIKIYNRVADIAKKHRIRSKIISE
ncbi:MAG: hypothetical protein Q8M06_09885 [Methanobacteriaceae archaeon]|nr:hypothetical protein [Methanobacteriaceae archaeon]